MDHFFCSVSSLMSLNLHSAVYSSIDDLVQFIEMYKLGNDFTGHFERRLPVLPQPITLTVVRHHFICLSLRNRKHFGCFYQDMSGSLGEPEILWEHELIAHVFSLGYFLKNNRKYVITKRNPACVIVKFQCYLNLYTHWSCDAT